MVRDLAAALTGQLAPFHVEAGHPFDVLAASVSVNPPFGGFSLIAA